MKSTKKRYPLAFFGMFPPQKHKKEGDTNGEIQKPSKTAKNETIVNDLLASYTES